MFAHTCYQYAFGQKLKSVTVNTEAGRKILDLERKEVLVPGGTHGCISACQGCSGASGVPEIAVCQSEKTGMEQRWFDVHIMHKV